MTAIFKRCILPAFCALVLLPACEKDCQQCYVEVEEPMDYDDTVQTYDRYKPGYIITSRLECEALADSLNRGNHSTSQANTVGYKYHCMCYDVFCD